MNELVPRRVEEGAVLVPGNGEIFHVFTAKGLRAIVAIGESFVADPTREKYTLCDVDRRDQSREIRFMRQTVVAGTIKMITTITCPRCVEILLTPYGQLTTRCSRGEAQRAMNLSTNNWFSVTR